MLTRTPTWAADLDRFLIANELRPFRYGSWDCCLFVADAIEVMTGVDLAESFRGKYTSLLSANKLVKEFCGSASVRRLIEMVAQRSGLPQLQGVWQAQRGDLILMGRPSNRSSLGLLALNGKDILTPAHRGLCLLPLSQGAAAWRI